MMIGNDDTRRYFWIHLQLFQIRERNNSNFSPFEVFRIIWLVCITWEIPLPISDYFRNAGYSGKAFPLSIQPLEGSCPWSWAHCEWNAHQLQSPKINGVIPKKVDMMKWKYGVLTLLLDYLPSNLHRFPSHSMITGRLKSKLQDDREWRKIDYRLHLDRMNCDQVHLVKVCVPPLYWYHDWTRMILFFELWKKHSPSFIIYANSYSRNVEKVLKYYEKKVSLDSGLWFVWLIDCREWFKL